MKSTPQWSSLGGRIEAFRKKTLGITQEAMAEKLDMHVNGYRAMLKTGHPGWQTLMHLQEVGFPRVVLDADDGAASVADADAGSNDGQLEAMIAKRAFARVEPSEWLRGVLQSVPVGAHALAQAVDAAETQLREMELAFQDQYFLSVIEGELAALCVEPRRAELLKWTEVFAYALWLRDGGPSEFSMDTVNRLRDGLAARASSGPTLSLNTPRPPTDTPASIHGASEAVPRDAPDAKHRRPPRAAKARKLRKPRPSK